MDSRKLAVGLVVLAIGIGVLWYLQRQAQPPQEQPETQPAGSRSAGGSTTAVAETGGAGTEAPEAGKAQAATAPAPKEPNAATRTSATQPGREEPNENIPPAVIPWGIPAGPKGKVEVGSLDSKGGKGFLVQATVRSLGGGLETVKLADYYATVEDKELAESLGNQEEYLRRVGDGQGEYKGHYSVLNPVSYKDKSYLALATTRAAVYDADGKELWRGDLARRQWYLGEVRRKPAGGDGSYEQEVSTTCTVYRDVPGDAPESDWPKYRFVTFRKTYTVRPRDYTISVKLSVENHTNRKLSVSVDQAGPSGVPKENYRQDMRHAAYGKVNLEDQRVQVQLKPVTALRSWDLGQWQRLGGSDDSNPVVWLGVVNQFFGSMMYLRPQNAGHLEATSYRAGFALAAAEESEYSRTFLTQVSLPGMVLPAGGSEGAGFDLFVGPKKREMFDAASAPYFREQYKRLGYLSTIDFGSCFCAVDWLVLGMMWLLQVLSVVALGNYGVAIIILVVLVRAALHPLMRRQQISMMKMQKLAPQMEELKKKYADDKDTLNKEMMKFYKQQGATPLLGCLPMFLQMPIWIALWTALRASIGLRHAAFLPVWLTNLAAPDTVFSWGTPLPLIGTSLHLLPLLLTVAMFLQTKFNPQMSGAATPASTPEQQQQQKMMKYMMPVMMLFIFYSMPSGLNLYIMTSTFAGVGEQYFIRKHMKKKEEEEALRETVVAAPGKGPRGSRPKKPKGPFWMKRG